MNELHKVVSVRPNAHDLAKRLIDGLEGNVVRVVVTDLAGGIYYARIVLERAGGRVEVDARPSDAIAIALRFEAPLFVDERLFEKALEGLRRRRRLSHLTGNSAASCAWTRASRAI